MDHPSETKVYTHAPPYTTLKHHLTAHLPTSLPLLRRLQFHKHSAAAHVLATFASTSSPGVLLDGNKNENNNENECEPWTAIYVDRSRAPETQCWVFSSLEAEFYADGDGEVGLDATAAVSGASRGVASGRDVNGNGPSPRDVQVKARSQLLALFRAVRELDGSGSDGVISSSSQDTDQTRRSLNESRNTLLVGAIHAETLRLITRDLSRSTDGSTSSIGSGNGNGMIQWLSEPWRTFLYHLQPSTSIDSELDTTSTILTQDLERSLEHDLEWDPPRSASDFALIRSRTAIPRTDATLAILPSVGLRDRRDGRLLAWAFLGVDGAVASLHVEPELRRRGVGRLVLVRVLRLLQRDSGREDGSGSAFDGVAGERDCGVLCGYSHAALGNAPGLAVAKAAGGVQRWTAYWTRIDLAAC